MYKLQQQIPLQSVVVDLLPPFSYIRSRKVLGAMLQIIFVTYSSKNKVTEMVYCIPKNPSQPSHQYHLITSTI